MLRVRLSLLVQVRGARVVNRCPFTPAETTLPSGSASPLCTRSGNNPPTPTDVIMTLLSWLIQIV
jgi:hypothetical protein